MKVSVIATTRYVSDEYDGESPENVIAHAGRVCYKSDARDRTKEFVQRRIKEGHESIIEHSSITFEIEDISRACSHQLVRHRLASYSQESQRYVEMSNPRFVIPKSIQENDNARRLFLDMMVDVMYTYEKLRELGILREDARFILPNAIATKIIVTMNYREMRHFFKVRCHKSAQWEIRELANEMLWHANKIAPSVFGDLYKEYYHEDKG